MNYNEELEIRDGKLAKTSRVGEKLAGSWKLALEKLETRQATLFTFVANHVLCVVPKYDLLNSIVQQFP